MLKYVPLLLAVFLTGCAFTDIPVTLPTKRLDPSVTGGRGRQVVLDTSFGDKRPITDRIGMQKNGYNMDTADARCSEDPAKWIATRINDELKAAGFDVRTQDQSTGAGALRVSGDLTQLFIEPLTGFWIGSIEADVSVDIVATSSAGLRASRKFFAKGTRKTMAFTKGQFAVALERASDDLVRRVVTAIVELSDRYSDVKARRTESDRSLAHGWESVSEGAKQ